MKKIPLLLTVIALMWSCNGPVKKVEQPEDTNHTLAATPLLRPVLKSLNGIEQGKARNMINYFAMNTDKFVPNSNTIWFSESVVAEIVNVLKSNSDFDGIRLYFAAEGFPANPKLSFVWVATMEDGADEVAQEQSKMRHKDIYLDASKYQLFKLSDIGGQASIIESNGMLLYKPGSGGSNDPSCPELPNNISIKYAEDMVAEFKTPHVINTHGEWFDRNLFLALAGTPHYGGIRIYYAKHPTPPIYPYYKGRDAFVITTTAKGVNNTDVFDCATRDLYNKYFFNKNRFTPPKDNGELCPNHCD
jgi:hypothetical protein